MELKFRYRFEAAHRFTQSASPQCMTPHGHTWHAILHLRARSPHLNPQMMVAEFSHLKNFWKTWIGEVVDHSYICNHKDPLLKTLLQVHPESRLLPCPGDPTTEMISLLFFAKMESFIQTSPINDVVEISAITIDETPTNSLCCDREFFLKNVEYFKNYNGWWQTAELHNRNLENAITN